MAVLAGGTAEYQQASIQQYRFDVEDRMINLTKRKEHCWFPADRDSAVAQIELSICPAD